MEIVDKTKYKQAAWQLGDVVKSENGLFALIVQNNTSNYCLINITASYGNSYSTSPVGRASKTYSNLESLYLACYPKWHKVIHGG